MGKNIKYVNVKAIDRVFFKPQKFKQSKKKNSNNLAPHIFFSEAGCGGGRKGKREKN